MSTTHSALHADHQLDQLAGQFEHWRQTRAHPSERIPQSLGDQAVALARVLPHTRVAHHLRLSSNDLKKRMAAQFESTPATPAGFVEVPPAPLAPLNRRRQRRSSWSARMAPVCAWCAPRRRCL